MPRLPHSRLALAAGALVVVAPLLSSCGFDYATDQVNTISAGVSNRDGEVDVLGAVIVAGQPNVGLLVATLVNNSDDEVAVFDGLAPSEEVSSLADPVAADIPRGGKLNLVDEGGLAVTGVFEPGDFVDVTLAFEGGQSTTLHVNVVYPCHQYALDALGVELPELEAPAGGEEPAVVEPVEVDCEALPAIEPHAEPEGGEEQ